MGTPFHHAAQRLATFLLNFFHEDSKRKDNSFIGRLTRDFYVSENKRNYADGLADTITKFYLEQEQCSELELETDKFVCGKIKHLFRKAVNGSKYRPASFETTLENCEKAIDRLFNLFDELKLLDTLFIPERRSSYEAINEMLFYIIENENKLFAPPTLFDYVDYVLPCLNKLPIVDSYKYRTVTQPAEEKKRLALKTAHDITAYLPIKKIQRIEVASKGENNDINVVTPEDKGKSIDFIIIKNEGKDIKSGLDIITNTARLNKELKHNPGRLKKHLDQAEEFLKTHKEEFEDALYSPKRQSVSLQA